MKEINLLSFINLMITDNPVWSVIVLLGCGLTFTAYVIYYILRMAHLEMQDEHDSTKGSNSESNQELR